VNCLLQLRTLVMAFGYWNVTNMHISASTGWSWQITHWIYIIWLCEARYGLCNDRAAHHVPAKEKGSWCSVGFGIIPNTNYLLAFLPQIKTITLLTSVLAEKWQHIKWTTAGRKFLSNHMHDNFEYHPPFDSIYARSSSLRGHTHPVSWIWNYGNPLSCPHIIWKPSWCDR
jgi:hypothetical protein